MAILYITEYKGTGLQTNQSIQSPMEPPLATQAVTFTGTAGVSVAFNANTELVRIHADGICSFRFSAAGTLATATDSRMSAGVTEYHSVPRTNFGGPLKVSAITNT